jgi:uncharacterized coiled-coil DUF342 family protein
MVPMSNDTDSSDIQPFELGDDPIRMQAQQRFYEMYRLYTASSDDALTLFEQRKPISSLAYEQKIKGLQRESDMTLEDLIIEREVSERLAADLEVERERNAKLAAMLNESDENNHAVATKLKDISLECNKLREENARLQCQVDDWQDAYFMCVERANKEKHRADELHDSILKVYQRFMAGGVQQQARPKALGAMDEIQQCLDQYQTKVQQHNVNV